MATHTPGPWRAEFSENGGYDCMFHAWHIKGEGRFHSIATLDFGSYGHEPVCEASCVEPEAEANARLIAAAPDLLAELKDVLRWAVEERAPLRDTEIASMRAAIAKAEGATEAKRIAREQK